MQQSITSGLEERGRETSADLGLEHFQNTAALLNVSFLSSMCVCVCHNETANVTTIAPFAAWPESSETVFMVPQQAQDTEQGVSVRPAFTFILLRWCVSRFPLRQRQEMFHVATDVHSDPKAYRDRPDYNYKLVYDQLKRNLGITARPHWFRAKLRKSCLLTTLCELSLTKLQPQQRPCIRSVTYKPNPGRSMVPRRTRGGF